MSTLTNGRDIFLLFLVEWTGNLFPQALRETEDSIQWSPQLMAHVGEEFILDSQGAGKVRVGTAEIRGAFFDALYHLIALPLERDFHEFAFRDIPGVIRQAGCHLKIMRSVLLKFIANSHHCHNTFVADNGNDDLAQDRDMSLGNAFLSLKRFIIVLNDRTPLADRLCPDPGLVHGKMSSIVRGNVE